MRTLRKFRLLLRALSRMEEARRHGGKPLTTQLRDVITLRKSGSGVGVDDYFDFRLFEKDVSPASLVTFFGERRNAEIADLVNDLRYKLLTWDKLVFHAWGSRAGLPVAECPATIRADTTALFQAPTNVTQEDELHEFLASREGAPIFLKPVCGTFGIAGDRLDDYDPITAQVRTASAGWKPLADLWEGLWHKRDFVDHRRGYLLQPVVEQHPTLSEAVGSALSTVRVVTLLDAGEVSFLNGFWKITTGQNVVDNFDSGKTGNLLAGIDVEAGTVRKVSRQYGGRLLTHVYHPQTGVRLDGYELPMWSKMQEVLAEAARSMPMMPLLHWDVGLTKDGPLLLEVNSVGSPHIVQYVNHEGFICEALRTAVKRRYESSSKMKPLPRWIAHP